MQQQYQFLHNRQQLTQKHDQQLQHQHEDCQCESYREDSKHYRTSTQISHRFIPPPIVQYPLNPTGDKYINDRLVEETDPRVKSLPYETTNQVYHDRKIIERDPNLFYNRENNLDPHRDPKLFRVNRELDRPTTTSEYGDRFKCYKPVTEEVPTERPEQCLDRLDTLLTEAGSQYLQEIGPTALDVMCDVTPPNESLMKILHPYMSVYNFDYIYPKLDSSFAQYRRQVLNSFLRNKQMNTFTLKTGQKESDPLAAFVNTTCIQPEQNLNNPDFNALQIVPKSVQHVPNFGLISENRAMFVDPKKMLDRGYRRIASYV